MPSFPPFIKLPIRQKGKWVCDGDSLQAMPGFGGAVSWMTSAIPYNVYPDSIVPVNRGVPGQKIGPSSDGTTMLALVSGVVAQYDASKNYNIALIWADGINDILNGRTASVIYADVSSWITAVKANPVKTIVVCPPKTNQSPAFQTERDALRIAELGNTAGADKVVDLDSIPGSAGDGINYNVDGYHLRTPGQTYAMNLILAQWKALVGLP